jgi:transposase InsO family protein
VVLTQGAFQNLGIRTVPVVEDTPTVSTARVPVVATGRTAAARARARAAQRAAARRVAAAAKRAPKKTVVPLTSVIYDPAGVAWVYTATATRTFSRTKIVIDHTTSDSAYLSSGPPVGSAVVTVGASELMGAEYGVGGE